MTRWPLLALLFAAWTAEAPLETDRLLYCGYWRSPFQVLGPLFVSLPDVSLFPWQLLLLALVPLCLLSPATLRRREWVMDGAIAVSLGSVAVTFLWGWMRGGSAYNAYYQLWRFLAALLVALLLFSAVRAPRHLRGLGLTVLAAALVRGTLAIYFYRVVVRGRIDPPPPYMTTHDDSMLFVAGLLVAVAWALARRTLWSWLSAVLVSAYLLYAITLNERRLAWIELVLVLALVYLALPRGRVGRRVSQLLVVAAPALVLYVLVGMDRPEPVFAPLRAFTTAGSYSDNSSMAREEEIRNLIYTLTADGNPLLGTGWGIPYQKVTSVYANFGKEWWQYAYLPHNSLLGLAVFGGLVGLGGIWCVVPAAAWLAMRGYRRAAGAPEEAAALSALCILPAYAVQCYGDIGFQSLTGSLILGVAVGVAGKVSAWTAVRPRRARAVAMPWPPARALAPRERLSA